EPILCEPFTRFQKQPYFAEFRVRRHSHMHCVACLIFVASLLIRTEPLLGDEPTDDQLQFAAYDGDTKTVEALLRRSPSRMAVNKALYDATLEGHQDTALAL